MEGTWVVNIIAENEEEAEKKAFNHMMDVETSRFRFRHVDRKIITEQGVEHS